MEERFSPCKTMRAILLFGQNYNQLPMLPICFILMSFIL